jgi:hypothetical protein
VMEPTLEESLAALFEPGSAEQPPGLSEEG